MMYVNWKLEYYGHCLFKKIHNYLNFQDKTIANDSNNIIDNLDKL